MGTTVSLIKAIEDDFKQRHPHYHKSRREALTSLAGVMLKVRNVNLMTLAAALPRTIGTPHDRYQYIERQLKNEKIDADTTMKPYALGAIKRFAGQGQKILLIMNQSPANDFNEVLMLAVCGLQRVLPVAWRVSARQDKAGVAAQKELLDSVKAWLPEESAVTLATDTSLATAGLIDWCQKAGWEHHLHLDGAESVTEEAALCFSGGVRWLFTGFESEGFGLMKSHIQKPDRLSKLILILSLALYWEAHNSP
ncbi:MAG: hypothetical protein WC612_05780 [Bdellovibrionales bacterium]|jgi:hypothetical protein